MSLFTGRVTVLTQKCTGSTAVLQVTTACMHIQTCSSCNKPAVAMDTHRHHSCTHRQLTAEMLPCTRRTYPVTSQALRAAFTFQLAVETRHQAAFAVACSARGRLVDLFDQRPFKWLGVTARKAKLLDPWDILGMMSTGQNHPATSV